MDERCPVCAGDTSDVRVGQETGKDILDGIEID